MKLDPARPMFTVDETAAILHVSRDIVYKLMSSGELEYHLVGRRRRIQQEELERYLDRQS